MSTFNDKKETDKPTVIVLYTGVFPRSHPDLEFAGNYLRDTHLGLLIKKEWITFFPKKLETPCDAKMNVRYPKTSQNANLSIVDRLTYALAQF